MTSRRRLLALGSAAALSALLAACSETTALSAAGDKAGERDYITGAGTVQEYSRPGPPVFFSGRTERGALFRSRDHLGQVLVVNTWYAACPPCRAEAPLLRRLSLEYAQKGVRFVGINVRDGAAEALAFDREFRIPYPSILDARTGDVQSAFRTHLPPNAVPTTLVLDRQGRIRARVLGQLTARSTLSRLIDAALAGSR